MAIDARIRERADQLWRVAPREPEEILLFGSYAEGDPRHDSDIDFLVIMKPDTTQEEKLQFARAIRGLDEEEAIPRLDVMPRTWNELRRELMHRAPRTARRALAAAQPILPTGRPSRLILMGRDAVRHGRLRWVASDFGLNVVYGNLMESCSGLGQYGKEARTIVVDEQSDDAAAAMALAHELLHFLLHPFEGSEVAAPCDVEGDDHSLVDNAAELVCVAIGLDGYRSYMSDRGRQYPVLDHLDDAQHACVQAIAQTLIQRYEATEDPPFRGKG